MSDHIHLNHDISKKPKLEKGNTVRLKSELPLGHGNKKPVAKGVEGYLTSDGFVAGYVGLAFATSGGVTHAKLNEEEAREFLEFTK